MGLLQIQKCGLIQPPFFSNLQYSCMHYGRGDIADSIAKQNSLK